MTRSQCYSDHHFLIRKLSPKDTGEFTQDLQAVTATRAQGKNFKVSNFSFFSQSFFYFVFLSVFLLFLRCLKVKSLSHVRLFATPWTEAHQAPLSTGILLARILEWAAISFSRGSSQPRDQTRISYISCISRWVLYH